MIAMKLLVRVDLQPAVIWHDKICTITRFQTFVKQPHVKADQKIDTQRKKNNSILILICRVLLFRLSS